MIIYVIIKQRCHNVVLLLLFLSIYSYVLWNVWKQAIAFIIDLSYLYGFGLIREKKERRVSMYCFVDIPEL